MQQHDYLTREQGQIQQRSINTDPRETGSGYPSQGGWQTRQRRRSPARTLIICLGALVVAALIAWLTGGFSFSSIQKTLPTRSFVLNGHGTLVVNEASGTLHVHKGTTNQVIVRGSEYAYGLTSSINNLQVQYTQNGNTITVSSNESWSLIGGSGLNLDVTVPASIDVALHDSSADATINNVAGQINASTSSGNLNLDNTNGPLNLGTSSGNITIINEQGPISAHTSSGNLHLENTSGTLNLGTSSGNIAITNEQGSSSAQTSSGDIRINQLSGPVNLSTSSGNITLDQAQLSGQDHLQTSSGDIHFNGTLDPQGSYQMETTSGSITVKLPASASFQLNTSSNSGSLHNDFAANASGTAPYARIEMKTSSGDMYIQKQ